MSEQSEALRLADALGKLWLADRQSSETREEAAAELRRLHAVNQELLAVLKELEYSSDGYIKRYPEESEVDAAIAKAEGQV